MSGRLDPLARVALLVVLIPCVPAAGCAGGVADEDALPRDWLVYENDAVGYSLEYPTIYSVAEFREGAVATFREGDVSRIVVNFAGPEQADSPRSLWFRSEPVGDVTLAGVAGSKYVYITRNRGRSFPTMSWVIPYRGKFLGLEFRREDEPGPLERRVIESFRLLDAAGGPR